MVCVLVELTVAGAAVGLVGLLFADTSFFMGTSFGCFTTFLAVVADDAKNQYDVNKQVDYICIKALKIVTKALLICNLSYQNTVSLYKWYDLQ